MTDSLSRIIPRVIQAPVKAVHILHGLLSKIFPGSPKLKRTDNIYVETLGLAGLFLYLANFTIFPGLHENGETMLIIAFLLAWGYWSKPLIRQPIFWLMLVFVLSLAISTMIGMNNFPEGSHLREAKRNLRLCLLIPLAWWIGANFRSIRNAFIIICLGFILSSLPWMLDWNVLGPALEGRRPRGLGLEVGGPRNYGLWIGFLLLGVVVLGRDLLPDWLKSGKKIFLGTALLFFIMIYLALILFIFQGKASWIAVLVTVPAGLVIRYFLLERGRLLSLKKLVLPLAALMLISVFIAAKYENISNRFSRDAPNIARLFAGKFDEIENLGSFGVRYHMGMWVLNNDLGISFFGHGPRSVQAISRDAELREKYGWDYRLAHLESDYWAILFRQGIFGGSVFILIVSFFIIQLYSGYRKKHIQPWFYSFSLMLILYVLIMGLTNITLRADGFLGLVGGLMFAAILKSSGNVSTDSKTAVEGNDLRKQPFYPV